jgi:hypothetical protein
MAMQSLSSPELVSELVSNFITLQGHKQLNMGYKLTLNYLQLTRHEEKNVGYDNLKPAFQRVF